MKKTLVFLLTFLLVLTACVFGASACNLEINTESTFDITADTKADSIELLNDFFKDILKDPNFVVTAKIGDEVQFTENVKGTASSYVAKDGSKIFAYIEDGIYFFVNESTIITEDEEIDYFAYFCSDESDEMGYYEDAKTYYDGNYCRFMQYIKIVELIPEDGGTFNCNSHFEEKNNTSTATLAFDFVAERGTVKITANAENGIVKNTTVVQDNKENAEQSKTYTFTFAYGAANFEKPDIAARIREQEEKAERINANEEAIDARDSFLFYNMEDDNMIATLMLGENRIFVETVANEIDLIEYDGYQIYTYIKQVGESDIDFYYVYDGGEENRYFIKNDDYAFSFNNMAYMNSPMFGIKAYDALVKVATFNYSETEEGNMLFTITTEEGGITINAVKEDELVKTIMITNGETVMTYTFEYGTATLSEPNLEGYADYTETDADTEIEDNYISEEE